MKREYYYDNLKLLLIFMVLLGHFCEISVSATVYGRMIKFFIYVFHMPLFAFISGLFCNCTIFEKVRRRSVGYCLVYIFMKMLETFLVFVLRGGWSFSLVNEGGVPWFMLAMSVWIWLAHVTRDTQRRVLFVISVLLALVLGYDFSLTTQFSISRIIVFWPFFLLGTMTDRARLQAVMKKSFVRIAGLILLIASLFLICFFYRKISFISPMLSGKNAYNALKDRWIPYGLFIRAGTYVLTVILSFSIMAVVPQRRFFFTKWGSRTLGIYFWCLPVYLISVQFFSNLRIWQYFIISILLIPVLGNGWSNDLLGRMIGRKGK